VVAAGGSFVVPRFDDLPVSHGSTIQPGEQLKRSGARSDVESNG
jgi:hypothetical protein